MSAPTRTVAIWGSDATRDAFAFESRASALAARLALVHDSAGSSWISQASPPWTGHDARPTGAVEEAPRRIVAEDLDKTIVDRLIERQPDLLVFDLIDERLPIVRVGRSWITASNHMQESEVGARALAEAEETCAATDPRRQALFAAAVPELARRLLDALPRTIFVLHEAPHATRVADGSALPEAQIALANELNAAQRLMGRRLVDAFGARLVRAVPPREVCLADPHHRRGVASCHYVEAYYEWLVDSLLAIASVVPDASPPLTSSAPRRTS